MTVIRTLQPAQARFARWLALAVLLHLGLLLLPIAEYGRRPAVPNVLAVALQRPPMPAPVPAPVPAHATDRPAPAEPPMEVAAPSQPTAQPRAPEPAPAAEPLADPVMPLRRPDVSAAHLLEQSRQRELRPPAPGERRRLGVFAPQAPPENWRPVPLPGESRFDGRALPDRVVIVDRWLAADGSHQVMVETPGGQLLCGRAEAWDPMQPLVEHVMMFRDCGPATPTFEWPEQYRRDPPHPPGESSRR